MRRSVLEKKLRLYVSQEEFNCREDSRGIHLMGIPEEKQDMKETDILQYGQTL